MKTKSNIAADDFRMPKEKLVLFFSISTILLFTIVILGITYFIPLFLILGSAITVLIRQKHLLGNCIKVTKNSFPEIYKASYIAASNLSMLMPDVFVTHNPTINAYAIGFIGRKSVVLHSALVQAMEEPELIDILGHEFSHIKCGHTFWLIVTDSKNVINLPIISTFFEFIFLYWSRLAEYTADRGGLIANSDLKSSTTALIKCSIGKELFGNVKVDELLEQIGNRVNATQLAEILLTHPYVINRIKKLSEFAESEKYKEICNNEIKREDDEILKFAKRAFESIKSTKNAGRIKENIQNLAKEIQNSYSNLKDRTINLNTKDEIFTNDYKFSKESNDSNATHKGKTENPSKENSSMNGKHQKYKLFKAIIDENVNEVKTIIEEGVNLNSSDKSGDTPLHLSVTLGSLEITRLLLSNGAYIDQPNKLGETPLKIAERKNLPEIALILKKECKHFVSIS